MKLTKLLLTSTTTILPALTLVSAKASNVKKEVNSNSFGSLPNAVRNVQGRSANIMVTPHIIATDNSNADTLKTELDRWWMLNVDYYIRQKVYSGSIISELEEKHRESSKNIIKAIYLLEKYILDKKNFIDDKPENVSWSNINNLIKNYHRYHIFLDQLKEIMSIDSAELVSKVDAYFKEIGIDTKENLDDDDLNILMWHEWHSLFSKSIKPLLDVKTAHDQVVAQNTALNAENQNLKDEASKLKAENTSLKTENLNLKDAAAKLLVENQNLKDESAKLKAENDALKTKNNQSKNDKENLQNQFDELTKKHDKLLAHNKKDKNKVFIFIAILLSINIILWVIIGLIIFKKSYKSKSSI